MRGIAPVRVELEPALRAGQPLVRVRVEALDPGVIGMGGALVVTSRCQVLDSDPVHGNGRRLVFPITLSGPVTEMDIDRFSFKAYPYQGTEVEIHVDAKFELPGYGPYDIPTRIEEVLAMPRPHDPDTARQEVDPKDVFDFGRNMRAIPPKNRAIVMALLVIGSILGTANMGVGMRDQMAPDGRHWFYSKVDSDGDSQSPLVGAGAVTGVLGGAVWFAVRHQLRKYMTFKLKPPTLKVRRGAELRLGDLIEGTARVDLEHVTIRVVAANMECGQYIRGSGTDRRTVSFREPVRAVVLHSVDHRFIPSGVPLRQVLDSRFTFDAAYDRLCPPIEVTGQHGVALHWEIQLIHPHFVDHELVGEVGVFEVAEFYAQPRQPAQPPPIPPGAV